MWNPLLELLFLEQANSTFASYLVDFALDLLCYKEEMLVSAR